MSLPREVLDDLSTQRFQENVAKKLDKKSINHGCLGGAQVALGNNTFSVPHSLGETPSSFTLLSHSTASSVKAVMVKADGKTATFSFNTDPGTFTVSFN